MNTPKYKCTGIYPEELKLYKMLQASDQER